MTESPPPYTDSTALAIPVTHTESLILILYSSISAMILEPDAWSKFSTPAAWAALIYPIGIPPSVSEISPATNVNTISSLPVTSAIVIVSPTANPEPGSVITAAVTRLDTTVTFPNTGSLAELFELDIVLLEQSVVELDILVATPAAPPAAVLPPINEVSLSPLTPAIVIFEVFWS